MIPTRSEASRDAPPKPPIRNVGGRRGSRTMLLGVLLAVVGSLTAWFAYTAATQGIEVVATARAIAYGATISESDLRLVEIPGGSTLRTIGWAERGSIVGQVANGDLAPDSLIAPDDIAAARLPRRGDAIVGLPVGPGRLPVSGLKPRDVVDVVRSDAPNSQLQATVLAVGDPDTAGRRTVDLIVPATAVDDVATAASDDRTLLVLVAAG